MNDKVSPIRQTNDEARGLVKTLLDNACFAGLAFADIPTGGHSISRIIVANIPDQGLVTLISDLSAHSQALALDSRCALMIGEPGKGDPLAHPRMSLIAQAKRLPEKAKEDAGFAGPFLSKHPKAELYFNFADFAFWNFSILRIDLNGGFGKAFQLTPDDLN